MSCAGWRPRALPRGPECPRPDPGRDRLPARAGPRGMQQAGGRLGLNEVGLCALASGNTRCPTRRGCPSASGRCAWPTHRRRQRIRCGGGRDRGLLFDTGPEPGALDVGWPPAVRQLDGIFVTHIEAEHAAGSAARWSGRRVRRICSAGREHTAGKADRGGGNRLRRRSQCHGLRDAGPLRKAQLLPRRSAAFPLARSLLVSGDLVFAGSAGGPYYCHKQLRAHLHRVLAAVPPDTVVAPGHAP